MTDELFEVRNLFTLGNYAGAVNAAISLRPTTSEHTAQHYASFIRLLTARLTIWCLCFVASSGDFC